MFNYYTTNLDILDKKITLFSNKFPTIHPSPSPSLHLPIIPHLPKALPAFPVKPRHLRQMPAAAFLAKILSSR